MMMVKSMTLVYLNDIQFSHFVVRFIGDRSNRGHLVVTLWLQPAAVLTNNFINVKEVCEYVCLLSN